MRDFTVSTGLTLTTWGDKNDMYKLYGIQTTYTPSYDEREPREDIERKLVATFDTIEQTKQYVEDSRLIRPVRNTWTNDYYFRENSLLARCGDYEIESNDIEVVPHNPNSNLLNSYKILKESK